MQSVHQCIFHIHFPSCPFQTAHATRQDPEVICVTLLMVRVIAYPMWLVLTAPHVIPISGDSLLA